MAAFKLLDDAFRGLCVFVAHTGLEVWCPTRRQLELRPRVPTVGLEFLVDLLEAFLRVVLRLHEISGPNLWHFCNSFVE